MGTPTPITRNPSPRTLFIGGLTAALTRQDAGWPSTVNESSGRVGDRMFSNTSFWGRQVSEWRGEFINTDHVAVRSLAARFDLPLEDVNAADPPSSTQANWFDGQYYTTAQMVEDLKPVVPILQQQMTGYVLDHMSVFEWIEQYAPGGHHRHRPGAALGASCWGGGSHPSSPTATAPSR